MKKEMKKLAAKVLAAAMLLSAVPAAAYPALKVEASKALRFDYTTAFCEDFEPNGSHRSALRQTIMISPYNGMNPLSERMFDSNVVLYGSSEELFDPYSNPAVTTPPSSNRYVGSETLNQASYSMQSAKESGKEVDGDYYDPNGFVKKLTTNGKGHVIITLKDEFSDSQKRIIREGSDNYFDLYVWPDEQAYENGTFYVRFQVGEYFKEDSTKLKHAFTSDGFIQDAEVTIDADSNATILSISDTDKKTRLKDADLVLNEIYVSGVPYQVKEIEETCFKSAKMKTVEAENLEILEAGAFRDCSRLKKVNFRECELTRIRNRVFYDCSKLANIKINGRELKSIGKKAFYGLKKNCKISIVGSKTKYKQVLEYIRSSKTSGVKCSRLTDDEDDDDDDDD